MKLPSDLIVDVMQAANPARKQAATRRLTELGATGATPQAEFASLLTTSSNQFVLPAEVNSGGNAGASAGLHAGFGPQAAGAQGKTGNGKDAYVKFEGFLLRTAFEDILPPADSGSFGEGFAGGVWRSMAAEQFANLFADQGGVGIAATMRKRLAGAAGESGPAQSGQWPYFEQPRLVNTVS